MPGIGGALTLGPLPDARAMRYRHAVLFATESGVSPCQRILFRVTGSRINR